MAQPARDAVGVLEPDDPEIELVMFESAFVIYRWASALRPFAGPDARIAKLA